MEHRMLGQRYELVEQLGHGGMGTVYRAVDHRLRRTVAVKTLSAELAMQPEFLTRFQREAHAAAALNHPGVATVHDVGEDSGGGAAEPYLVMEYVAGRPLSQVLGDGPLAVAQAVDVAGQVLAALDHSHRHAIVHRDIKPANVMLTASGAVKVVDFGIAKALSEVATRLTGTGVAVGTPAYLAPEQINGAATDHRTDLYAVGCLLYELLTGRPPYTGDSPFSVMHQHLAAEPVPPSRLRPELPPAVDAVIIRALHKRREDRFADAATMRTALTAAPHAAPSPAASTPTPTALDPAAAGPAMAPAPTADPAPSTGPAPAVAPPAPAGSAPSPRPVRRRPGRVVFRPTAEGAVALLGCLLCLVISRADMIEVGQFSRVALLAAVAGSVLLLWSARLACAVAWGPVAEAVAVWSELARANIGWETHFVIIALVLGAVSALCLAAGYKDEHTGGFALIAFWFTSLAAVWFFLDDLRKIGVFYVLLLAVTLAIGAQVLKTRTRASQSGDGGAPGPSGADPREGAVPPAAVVSRGRGRQRIG
ncbi:serine/threonine-protein kinase [Streptomyces lydicamycinicus]|uniref:non-specific serine/threonine protein kinase n=1 Tax=Streptomyces lydicamycinicus TaxID=1546107 RepID=A0A0P4R3V3_9ACTN|nr:protein kinase [Streptomyces lydicamycinicus]GAO07401.1 serine/threonine-protein kinase [Streptomyces lydicamycinicus]